MPRKPKSEIRQNIVEILYFLKKGYGYDIYQIYKQLFSRTTMRNIYYHLKKGTELEEFKVNQIKSEKGNYTWGDTAEKVYYELGKQASPRIDKRVKNFLEKKKLI